MNWTECPLVEIVPGRMAGAPVIHRSRVRPQDLLENREQGAEWLADAYGLALDDVNAILAFYDRYQRQLAPAI